MTISGVLRRLRESGLANVTARRVGFAIETGKVSRPEIEAGRFSFQDSHVTELRDYFIRQAEKRAAATERKAAPAAA